MSKRKIPPPQRPFQVLSYSRYSKGAASIYLNILPKKRKLPSATTVCERCEQDPGNITVLNWGYYGLGSGEIASNAKTVLNNADAVKRVSVKNKAFDRMDESGISIPRYTTDLAQAMDWIADGEEVLGRDQKGRGGEDIVFYADDPGSFTKKKLFTVYKKKKSEFRIHVFRHPEEGLRVISEQRKVLRNNDSLGSPINPEDADFRIRSYKKGFVFQRNNITVPEGVREQAILAVDCLGLDFGGVDVIWNEYEQKPYVLEVNTAPGLAGTTLKDYINAVNEWLPPVGEQEALPF